MTDANSRDHADPTAVLEEYGLNKCAITYLQRLGCETVGDVLATTDRELMRADGISILQVAYIQAAVRRWLAGNRDEHLEREEKERRVRAREIREGWKGYEFPPKSSGIRKPPK